MPLYDFRCAACEHEFEAAAAPGQAATCPACGADGAQRLWRPIAPPAKIGLRGHAARRSESDRARAREQRRSG